jgi:hypothetical protein
MRKMNGVKKDLDFYRIRRILKEKKFLKLFTV